METEPVDLNGDSVSGNDLFEEFSGLDVASGALNNSVIKVVRVNDFDAWSDRFFVWFPLQGLDYCSEVRKREFVSLLLLFSSEVLEFSEEFVSLLVENPPARLVFWSPCAEVPDSDGKVTSLM